MCKNTSSKSMYIGTKIVKANPMTATEAQVLGVEIKPATVEKDGYLVEYKNGYKSWSPKSVFEEAYHELSVMNFGNAISVLKSGYPVRRANWSGNKFLYFVPSASYSAMTDIAKSIADEDGKVLYKPYIAIRCKDGCVGFYTPTQCDVLAEDWEVVEEKFYGK
ncbi:DUF2829 domain-containing protein [Prevotella copri]|uniref:DUF2829 domain-containing protein n=1 Tax=Segatella copri TaxID=165179 RepID=A0AAW4YEJ7_9BACT|nr:DUF2829 domain-containing protein [Segatella copri]MCE4121627.1 DUF2829 domain-containing protein [Segatella copri]MCP9497994.1 DUF2829 domain-containing protein [Segatella copri]MCP9512933.1 DUF2829 domain-containing protein [Segatella copri]MCP9521916.1 DUF2829 domain-containing protein [Segatella copri]